LLEPGPGMADIPLFVDMVGATIDEGGFWVGLVVLETWACVGAG
jgi:hypothetical protein